MQSIFKHTPSRALALLFLSSCLASSAIAQELLSTTSTTSSTPSSTESSCFNSSFASVPSRPTVANATDTTPCGVVELEYGLERQWPGGGANRDDLSGGLRFGLTPKLDFHWSSSEFVHLMNADGDRTGYGDNWLGLKYRFVGQAKHRPGLGVFYDAKVPSASVALGLGSGKVDHSISFLASKDVSKVHFDFNVIELLAGRPTATGFDHNTGFALATWVPVTKRLTGVVEPYGYTSLNQLTPGFASAMVGFNYKVQPRVYLDGGLDMGVTHDAPHKRVFVGVTYALANVYSWIKPR
jgi:Putative MetA-pathway of phenol degradation